MIAITHTQVLGQTPHLHPRLSLLIHFIRLQSSTPGPSPAPGSRKALQADERDEVPRLFDGHMSKYAPDNDVK